MTAQERQALWFLLALTVLGTGVRVVRGHETVGAAVGDSAALDGQIAAVDSAIGGAHGKKGSGRRPRPEHSEPPKPVDASATLTISAIPEVRTTVGVAGSGGMAGRADAPVDVDVAGQAELESLPFVGPRLAERILGNREKCGAFGSLEGLKRVPGVGPGIAERLSERVTFSGVPRPLSTVPSQCDPSRSSSRGASRNQRP